MVECDVRQQSKTPTRVQLYSPSKTYPNFLLFNFLTFAYPIYYLELSFVSKTQYSMSNCLPSMDSHTE